MNSVLEALKKYFNDDKLLVDYLYTVLKLFEKYGNSIYNYDFSNTDTKFSDILDYFKEEKYTKKDIYNLLMQAIEDTGYNVYNLKLGGVDNSVVKFDNVADVIKEDVTDDIGVYAKSADNKIYKRFLLDDVKKILNLN